MEATIMKNIEKRFTKRGASMVEYALLLVAVLILGASAFRFLGEKVGQKAQDARSALDR